MGRDHQAKDRQQQRQSAKLGRRAAYSRLLIVTEGSKTEPQYLEEIRSLHKLHSANVAVQPAQLGTEPIRVVQYAQRLFESGDLHRGIRPRQFDGVFVVFDRDAHATYNDALQCVQSLNGRLRNDERQPVMFKAVVSIPCFELWLLLHYEDIRDALTRGTVMARLKRCMPSYAKGARGVYLATRSMLSTATQRARALAQRNNAHTAPEPYTGMHELVTHLITLKEGLSLLGVVKPNGR